VFMFDSLQLFHHSCDAIFVMRCIRKLSKQPYKRNSHPVPMVWKNSVAPSHSISNWNDLQAVPGVFV
ncbi:MAG: hypothetical protein ACKOKB_09380, partial [Bacteroidota bacterium]